TPIKIATRSVTVGPIYVWRNVFDISRAGPAPEHNYGWPAFKAGNYGSWSHGKFYVFHNTILQPPPPDSGSSSGIISGSSNTLGNMFTRNNILHISKDKYNSISNQNQNSTNDFDYDLYNGRLNVSGDQEAHGIRGVPTYVPSSGYDRTSNRGIFELSSSSLGYDAGEVIPNFNDNFIGEAPDVGAHEAGTPPMEFGVDVWSFNVLEPGLVGLWKLDEADGGIAYDSARAHDGTLNGNPLWQPVGGQIDGALAFDGTDDYVSTDHILDPADGPFSVFAWIKGGAPGQVIMSQIQSGVNWLLADPAEGKLMTELQGTGRGGNVPVVSETEITDGNWHRVGFVWDGSNRILYTDDAEVAKNTQPGLEGSAGGLYIGAGNNLESGSFFSGLIDDVRIYDRAIMP
ncbi:MAG: LamG domain-containing protein, partial [Planctomycetota bacterium]